MGPGAKNCPEACPSFIRGSIQVGSYVLINTMLPKVQVVLLGQGPTPANATTALLFGSTSTTTSFPVSLIQRPPVFGSTATDVGAFSIQGLQSILPEAQAAHAVTVEGQTRE